MCSAHVSPTCHRQETRGTSSSRLPTRWPHAVDTAADAHATQSIVLRPEVPFAAPCPSFRATVTRPKPQGPTRPPLTPSCALFSFRPGASSFSSHHATSCWSQPCRTPRPRPSVAICVFRFSWHWQHTNLCLVSSPCACQQFWIRRSPRLHSQLHGAARRQASLDPTAALVPGCETTTSARRQLTASSNIPQHRKPSSDSTMAQPCQHHHSRHPRCHGNHKACARVRFPTTHTSRKALFAAVHPPTYSRTRHCSHRTAAAPTGS